MRWACLSVTMLLASSCSSPVMFRLDVDEKISSAELVLNGEAIPFERKLDGAYWASWYGSDASGKINITYPDGKRATCQVGYVTHGMIEPQRYSVKQRKCGRLLEND